MSIVKKIGKFLGILILVLIGLLVITLISTTILHKVKQKSNLEFLEEQGFYNPVSVGDHSLNLIEYGGSENGYRITQIFIFLSLLYVNHCSRRWISNHVHGRQT